MLMCAIVEDIAFCYSLVRNLALDLELVGQPCCMESWQYCELESNTASKHAKTVVQIIFMSQPVQFTLK